MTTCTDKISIEHIPACLELIAAPLTQLNTRLELEIARMEELARDRKAWRAAHRHTKPTRPNARR